MSNMYFLYCAYAHQPKEGLHKSPHAVVGADVKH